MIPGGPDPHRLGGWGQNSNRGVRIIQGRGLSFSVTHFARFLSRARSPPAPLHPLLRSFGSGWAGSHGTLQGESRSPPSSVLPPRAPQERPAAMWGHLGLYLAEPGLKRQRGGRFRTLHAGGCRGEGPRPVCPMAAGLEDRIPGLGCAPHVCPGESVFLRETGKRNVCPPLEHGSHISEPSPISTFPRLSD